METEEGTFRVPRRPWEGPRGPKTFDELDTLCDELVAKNEYTSFEICMAILTESICWIHEIPGWSYESKDATHADKFVAKWILRGKVDPSVCGYIMFKKIVETDSRLCTRAIFHRYTIDITACNYLLLRYAAEWVNPCDMLKLLLWRGPNGQRVDPSQYDHAMVDRAFRFNRSRIVCSLLLGDSRVDIAAMQNKLIPYFENMIFRSGVTNRHRAWDLLSMLRIGYDCDPEWQVDTATIRSFVECWDRDEWYKYQHWREDALFYNNSLFSCLRDLSAVIEGRRLVRRNKIPDHEKHVKKSLIELFETT